MKSIEIGRSRVVIVAIALAVAALAYLDAQGSVASQAAALADRETASGRSPQASGVEAEVARAGLVVKLEAALGDAFGGVWFDAATAQLHVGVTSPLSRRNAEAVAAQAGLAGNVTATAVRWTWAQLGAAQERWNHRLVELFEREPVRTSLAAEDNSVLVEVGASTSASKRAVLERETAAATVEASVEVLPSARLRFTPYAKCLIFEVLKAHCDPSIVSGVSIEDETVGLGDCTAGPALIKTKRPQKAIATETFVLTAGHCIKIGGGAGKKWYAINKEQERKEIGKAVDHLTKEVGVGADGGVIKIEANWADAEKNNPVVASIANWNAFNESEPFPVIKQQPPVAGQQACFSGQRSGIKCGKIEKTGLTRQFKDIDEIVVEEWKEVAELTLENGAGGKGDSGAPVFAESPYVGKLEGFVEGILVGGASSPESETIYYQPLSFILAELTKQKKLEYKLLTSANEKRHANLKAGKYPVTIHGSTAAAHKFTVEGKTIECKENAYHAVLSEPSSTLTVTPSYKGCTAFGLAATVEMEGCTYVLHVAEKESTDNYLAYADVSCPAGKSIKISVPSVGCKLEVKSQNELGTVDLVDDTGASPKKDVTVQPTLKGIAYTVTQDGAFCPLSGTGEKTGGEHTSAEGLTVTGQNPSGPSEKIDIEVADE